MANGTNIELATTCGIEIEIDNLPRNCLKNNLLQKKWRSVHDASCETDYLKSAKLELNFTEKNPEKRLPLVNPVNGVVVGTELVSHIFNSDDPNFFCDISDICSFLISEGEPRESERSGIHFHISLPNPNLKILKSLLRLGRYFEVLFFYAGSMGYKFRGETNDALYCRPITKWGPPCIRYFEDYSQVFTVGDLLKTKTINQFWDRFGDIRNHDMRYNPSRYVWLNIFGLYPGREYKGSVEFRVFNKTLNPIFITSAFFLCRKFVELAISNGFRELKELNLLKSNSIFTKPSKNKALDLLDTFKDLTGLDEKYYETISYMIKNTTDINMQDGYIYTHLLGRLDGYWKRSKYKPKTIPKNSIRKPKYIDIHVLRGERNN